MNEKRSGETMKAQNQKSNKRLIVIGVFLIAVITFLVMQKIDLERQNQEKELALNQAFVQLDSLSNELDERILTISKLGGEIDTLLSIKSQLETEKKLLLDRQERSKQSIATLQDKVEGYQELLLIKDEEINQLTAINEKLLSENSDLKVETSELNKSIKNINKEKQQLQGQIAMVSRLRIEAMTVYALKEDKERANEFRNRHIDELKIQFTVGENLVAPIEGKALLLRIVAPDGNVLFDVTRGSGTFIFEGREQFFTAQKEILFDRSAQLVTLNYDKGSEFAVGRHEVEVYTDQYLMGKGSFVVK